MPTPSTVQDYLATLPPDRRDALNAIRKVILANLDDGYEEGMQYGMIGYYVPHRVHPAGYHCDPKQPLPFGGLASRKNFMTFYAMSLYGSPTELKWFQDAWAKAGKKLVMGKSCINFKSFEDVPLEVIGECFRRMPSQKYIAFCEAAVQAQRDKKTAEKKPSKPKARQK